MTRLCFVRHVRLHPAGMLLRRFSASPIVTVNATMEEKIICNKSVFCVINYELDPICQKLVTKNKLLPACGWPCTFTNCVIETELDVECPHAQCHGGANGGTNEIVVGILVPILCLIIAVLLYFLWKRKNRVG